jgi:hypothetical protein
MIQPVELKRPSLLVNGLDGALYALGWTLMYVVLDLPSALPDLGCEN